MRREFPIRRQCRDSERVLAAALALQFLPSRSFRSMKPTIRIVTRGNNGELRTKDYEKHETVLKMHTQIGVDDCSTDLSLRGMPVFRGLIGPMPEAKGVVRYESPEVFETLTKEWTTAATSRSRRRSTTPSYTGIALLPQGAAARPFAQRRFVDGLASIRVPADSDAQGLSVPRRIALKLLAANRPAGDAVVRSARATR